MLMNCLTLQVDQGVIHKEDVHIEVIILCMSHLLILSMDIQLPETKKIVSS